MPVIIAAAALAVSAYSAVEQHKEAKKAAAAQRESSRINNNSQKASDIAQRRQKYREERIRRAQIIAQASASGASGSSGEAGAVAGLDVNTGISTAFTSAKALASEGVSTALQSAANHEGRANTWGQIGQVSNTVFGATGSSLFETTTTTTPKPTFPRRTNF